MDIKSIGYLMTNSRKEQQEDGSVKEEEEEKLDEDEEEIEGVQGATPQEIVDEIGNIKADILRAISLSDKFSSDREKSIFYSMKGTQN